jgi:hypothetical protein
MIEQTILDYLNDTLTEPCYMEEPEGIDTFVLLEKTGSSLSNYVYSATFAIQSYATSLYEAAELNEKVKAAMLTIADELNTISKCSLNSDYNYTDTTKKRYRYQAVFDITHY